MLFRQVILPRYLVREVWPLFAAGLLLFVLLLFLDVISTAAGSALKNQTSFLTLGQYLLSYLPQVLRRALPLAIPFAVLLALGRLAKDSELKVAYGAGVRPLALLYPLMFFGLLISVLAFVNSAFVQPAAETLFKQTQYRVFYNTDLPRYQNMYIKSDAVSGALFYAGTVNQNADGRSALLSGVMVKQKNSTYTALNGVWDLERKTWLLENATQYQSPELPLRQLARVTFPYKAPLPTTLVPETLSLNVLWDNLHSSIYSGTELRKAWFDFHRRFADALTALFFVFAAGAIGLLLRNQAGAFIGVVLMIFGFYVVWTAMPSLVGFNALAPWLAAWLPNFMLGLLGLSLLRLLW